jgi:hypothetical protein
MATLVEQKHSILEVTNHKKCNTREIALCKFSTVSIATKNKMSK